MYIITFSIIFALLFSSTLVAPSHEETKTNDQISEATELPKYVHLSVPYISQVPDNTWKAPWNNACEEASISMVEQYYLGIEKITKNESKKMMSYYFPIQNKIFGSNTDSNSERNLILINQYSKSFKGSVVENPTVEDLKQELANGRPIITHHHGFSLNNPNLHFRRGGSSYHVMVLVGYDETNKEFLTHDPGVYNGVDYRYKYDIILASLHDFDHKTKKANGPKKVIFTRQHILAKTKDSNRIFLIDNGQKKHIINPLVFKKNNWKWSDVIIVKKEFLDKFATGEKIS